MSCILEPNNEFGKTKCQKATNCSHKEKFGKILNEYYELRGCDIDGIPKETTFQKLGLSVEEGQFTKRLRKVGSGQTA